MVTISDRAKAVLALSEEKEMLFNEALQLNSLIDRTNEEFFIKMKQMSDRQALILQKIIAIDDSLEKVLK